MSLIQLEYILALDTFRHFHTAAEHCHVTQPTLSLQIKKLEEKMGVMIFDRSRQPVIPTDIGKLVIDQARNVIREHQKIRQIIDESQQKVAGELTIGIIPTLAPYLLPLFIGGMARKYKGLSIEVRELLTEEIIHQLKNDHLDVGILVTPLHKAGIVEKPLFYEAIKVYANYKHPFAQAEAVDSHDIASPDIWLLSEGHCFRSQMLNLCSYQQEKAGELPVRYQSGSLETLKKMVDIEGGFTLLPELAISDLHVSKLKQVKPFSNETPVREVSMAYVWNFAKSRLLSILEKEILAAVPEEMLANNRGKVVDLEI